MIVVGMAVGLGFGVFIGWYFGERSALQRVAAEIHPQMQAIIDDLEALEANLRPAPEDDPANYTGVSP